MEEERGEGEGSAWRTRTQTTRRGGCPPGCAQLLWHQDADARANSGGRGRVTTRARGSFRLGAQLCWLREAEALVPRGGGGRGRGEGEGSVMEDEVVDTEDANSVAAADVGGVGRAAEGEGGHGGAPSARGAAALASPRRGARAQGRRFRDGGQGCGRRGREQHRGRGCGGVVYPGARSCFGFATPTCSGIGAGGGGRGRPRWSSLRPGCGCFGFATPRRSCPGAKGARVEDGYPAHPLPTHGTGGSRSSCMLEWPGTSAQGRPGSPRAVKTPSTHSRTFEKPPKSFNHQYSMCLATGHSGPGQSRMKSLVELSGQGIEELYLRRSVSWDDSKTARNAFGRRRKGDNGAEFVATNEVGVVLPEDVVVDDCADVQRAETLVREAVGVFERGRTVIVKYAHRQSAEAELNWVEGPGQAAAETEERDCEEGPEDERTEYGGSRGVKVINERFTLRDLVRGERRRGRRSKRAESDDSQVIYTRERSTASVVVVVKGQESSVVVEGGELRMTIHEWFTLVNGRRRRWWWSKVKSRWWWSKAENRLKGAESDDHEWFTLVNGRPRRWWRKTRVSAPPQKRIVEAGGKEGSARGGNGSGTSERGRGAGGSLTKKQPHARLLWLRNAWSAVEDDEVVDAVLQPRTCVWEGVVRPGARSRFDFAMPTRSGPGAVEAENLKIQA
ncbi:hypothetical protein K438DRAFT_1782313 [Mycena galopus ATCC 62051]|nr:hypothetical protein K438DRAFT_1782313 [Mycena galopus ATCC 62051]